MAASRVVRFASSVVFLMAATALPGLAHPSDQGSPPAKPSPATPPPATPEAPKPATPTTPATPPPATPPTSKPGKDQPTEALPAEQKYPDLFAVLETDAGVIRVKLAPNQVPRLVAHFANLVNRGFYKQMTFYSVVRGLQIHSGDPTDTGEGGCGYTVPKAFHKDLLFGQPGVFALWTTRGNPSSQFVITLAPNAKKFDLNETGIGHVVEGLDVAGRITKGAMLKSIKLEGDASRLMADFTEELKRWNEILDRERDAKTRP